MLGALMNECKYKNGRTLGDREVAHIMIALLMAGQHTSSATSSWTLLHLASRPDVWYGLFCEIWPTKNSLFASSGNNCGKSRSPTSKPVTELSEKLSMRTSEICLCWTVSFVKPSGYTRQSTLSL